MRRRHHRRRIVYCPGIFSQPNIRLNDTALNSLQGLSADAHAVARAMALFWTWRGRTPVYELLRHFGTKSASRKDFTQENVRVAQRELAYAGLLVEQDGRPGFSQMKDELRGALYRELLDAMQAGDAAKLAGIPENMFQAGTSEIKNWIVVAGVMAEAGLKMNLVDYVPCYRSEAGTGSAMGFARWG